MQGCKHSASYFSAPSKSAHPKKQGRKSGPDAVDNVALAVCDIANALQEPDSTSPKHRTAAVQALEQDRYLIELEEVKAIQLFQKKTAIADSYLAIKNVTVIELFIQAETTQISEAEST